MNSLPFISAQFDAEGNSFASAYQALDAHRIRVTPVQSADTPSVEYACAKGVKITCLVWIAGAEKQKPPSRKRAKAADQTGGAQIAVGTSTGTILVYSPSSNQVLKTLGTAPSPAVVALSAQNDKLYALHADGTIAEWNVARESVAHTKSELPDLTAVAALPDNGLLLANTQPHLSTSEITSPSASFAGFASPVRQLVVGAAGDRFLAIAEQDRLIQSYSVSAENNGHPLNLLSGPSNATFAAVSSDDSGLAVATDDGTVLLFSEPFKSAEQPGSNSSSRRRAKPQYAKPTASIVVKRPNGDQVNVQRVFFLDDFLVLSWSEQGAVPIFARVQWKKDGQIIDETVELVKDFAAPRASEHLVNGVDAAAVPAYKESTATISSGHHVADLDDEDSDEEGGETLADRLEALEVKRQQLLEDSDAEDEAHKDGEFSQNGGAGKMKLSTPGSFAALLNQALVAGDKQLLETCLSERDEKTIKTSIIKLEPSLAAKLLERLAEKMARVQHRSAQLTVWIKWVIVVHGGYLVTVPNLLKTLASLHSTLATRVAILPRLLALQGRLELLSAQLDVRGEILESSREIEDDTEDIAEAVYTEDAFIVNGEEDFDEAGEDDEDEQIEEDEDVEMQMELDDEEEAGFEDEDDEDGNDEEDSEDE
ncbi:U3 small nucleolar RNA-associated protein 5 [Wickerhamiella sorbophila]|uniref:U3 small nucleolar RNA-associated protein 5 n=1 Tax=Wickerhamiella sorbophila TaxID=45607 RepID=A0A2T0FKV6_9ASCO|nr:U3 small nucleolar RNA-associated protein 5 [Wickerhamiella sorbophila]PRT55610.1 U3 small nucleolar RNA-associated protein 5 [Wickerhamiella sorbophila]